MEFTELIDGAKEIIFSSFFYQNAPSPPIKTNSAWLSWNLFSPRIAKLDINSSPETIPV